MRGSIYGVEKVALVLYMPIHLESGTCHRGDGMPCGMRGIKVNRMTNITIGSRKIVYRLMSSEEL
jgi:hypothetical protein